MQGMQEMHVGSLGQEDSLKEKMAIYSSILAWRILWTERSLVGYSPWGHKELDMIEQLSTRAHKFTCPNKSCHSPHQQNERIKK